jgi:hypothetical protein
MKREDELRQSRSAGLHDALSVTSGLTFSRLRSLELIQPTDLGMNAHQFNLLREDKVDGLVAELPTWYAVWQICALIPPSSGAPERVVSLLKHIGCWKTIWIHW